MSKEFKKDIASYRSEQADTPYLKAKQEWDERIGNTMVQAKNWRMVAVLSMLIGLILLILLLIVISTKKNVLYVAQVEKTGRVVNVVPLQKAYQPTTAQTEYFISNFVKMVRGLSLDPIVAKQNWMNAYAFLTKRSSEQLNKYMQNNSPLQWLGKKTIVVKVDNINSVSKNTYQVGWTETTIDQDGTQEKTESYSGVFTAAIKAPTNQKEILLNPLGIYIVDLNISLREE